MGDKIAKINGRGVGTEIDPLRLPDHFADLHGEPVQIGERAFFVTCSIGIPLYPGDGSSLDELLRRADGAMQDVKAAGRAGWVSSAS